MRDLWLYVQALGRHWIGLVTGPVATLMLLIWQQFAKIAIPNWVFWVVLATGIPIAGFLAWREEHQAVQGLTKKPTLQLRFLQQEPYLLQHRFPCYRVGVYNSGPAPAENVKVSLESIQPRPRDRQFRGGFPHHVGFRVDEYITSAGVQQMAGRTINGGEEEYFELAKTWRSSDGRRIVTGLDGFEELAQGSLRHWRIAMEDDECWNLELRISAANADRQTVGLRVSPVGDHLNISLSTVG